MQRIYLNRAALCQEIYTLWIWKEMLRTYLKNMDSLMYDKYFKYYVRKLRPDILLHLISSSLRMNKKCTVFFFIPKIQFHIFPFHFEIFINIFKTSLNKFTEQPGVIPDKVPIPTLPQISNRYVL